MISGEPLGQHDLTQVGQLDLFDDQVVIFKIIAKVIAID